MLLRGGLEFCILVSVFSDWDLGFCSGIFVFYFCSGRWERGLEGARRLFGFWLSRRVVFCYLGWLYGGRRRFRFRMGFVFLIFSGIYFFLIGNDFSGNLRVKMSVV